MQTGIPDPYTPENWLRYARSDLAVARNFVGLPDVLLQTLCFHAQQAAEKSLKAVLLSQGINFPYTHDLSILVTLVQNAELPWVAEFNAVVDLTRYSVAGRYPGGIEAPTETEYRESVEIAEQIFVWAENLIGGITP